MIEMIMMNANSPSNDEAEVYTGNGLIDLSFANYVGTDFIDATGINWVTNGAVSPQNVEGRDTGLFSGGHLVSTLGPGFDIGNGDFVIKAVVKPRVQPNGSAIVSTDYASTGKVSFALGFQSSAGHPGPYPFFGFYNGSWWTLGSNQVLPLDRFSEIRVEKIGTTIRLYIDDVLVASSQFTHSLSYNANSPIYIGRRWDGQGNPSFDGWIDKVIMYRP